MNQAATNIGQLQRDAASGLWFRLRTPVPSAPRSCIVLLHGVGGDETNFAPLAGEFPDDALVVLARGPLTLGPGQFGWFHVAFSATGPAIAEAEADESRLMLARLLAQLQATHGVPADSTIIAGFSQGGIMSASVALTMPQSVAGFGVLSGRILPEIKPHLASRQQLGHLRAFIAHGLHDNKLPVTWAQRSNDWLDQLGEARESHLYPIGHAVSEAMQGDFLQWVRSIASGSGQPQR
jgi:phospholipase/carboxylesterase